MKLVGLLIVFGGSLALAKPIIPPPTAKSLTTLPPVAVKPVAKPAAKPVKLKSISLRATEGITLSDKDRQAWISSVTRLDGATRNDANMKKMVAASAAAFAKAQTDHAALWSKLKTDYPGLADGMLIDVKTGVVSAP